MTRQQPDPDDSDDSSATPEPSSPSASRWAELDREDLAELASGRGSVDRDPETWVADQQEPTAARWAQHLWWVVAASGVAVLLYSILAFGNITDAVRDRIAEGNKENRADPMSVDQIDWLARWMPIAMLVTLAVLLIIQTALIRGVLRHRSRHCRNMFLAFGVVILLGIVIGVDLLLRYNSVPVWVRGVSWLQCAAMVASMVAVMSRPVGKWLPPSHWLPHRNFTARR